MAFYKRLHLIFKLELCGFKKTFLEFKSYWWASIPKIVVTNNNILFLSKKQPCKTFLLMLTCSFSLAEKHCVNLTIRQYFVTVSSNISWSYRWCVVITNVWQHHHQWIYRPNPEGVECRNRSVSTHSLWAYINSQMHGTMWNCVSFLVGKTCSSFFTFENYY